MRQKTLRIGKVVRGFILVVPMRFEQGTRLRERSEREASLKRLVDSRETFPASEKGLFAELCG